MAETAVPPAGAEAPRKGLLLRLAWLLLLLLMAQLLLLVL